MTFVRRALTAVVVLVGVTGAAVPASADPAMFSFGEMRELQRLPAEGATRMLTAEETILYQNVQFYTFTVFETLLAANNAVLAAHRAPLFCAPEGTFRFEREGDIAALARRLTDEVDGLIAAIGGAPDHYDRHAASEALLMALRAAFPCEHDVASVAGR